MGRGTDAFLVPKLYVVVSAGLVQGAAAAIQLFVGGVPPQWHRGIHLREAGFSSGAVVNIVYGVVLPVAGCEL